MRNILLSSITLICIILISPKALSESNILNITFCDTQSPKTINKGELETRFAMQDVDYLNNYPNLGIGIVNPKDYSFTLFFDTESYLKVYIDDIETQKMIIPLIYKPDYQLFYMIVTQKVGDYYEVILNDGLKGYVLRNEFDFYTWETFLTKKNLCIGASKGYAEPNIQSKDFDLSEDNNYIVKKMNGNWLFVEEDLGEDNLKTNLNKYWVQWKNEKGLNVVPILLQ